ncbi:HAMP domain-containing sensor histidine kinase [Clostridium sediminicola]|uniref:sensor histidine kinase n=1 Tax=Clostridium sediminicola TaxID=3114879 RepID=UPI0031F2696B
MKMNFRKKMILMNIGIIIPILFIFGVCLIETLDSYNLVMIRDYLLNHSYTTQVNMTQYFESQQDELDMDNFKKKDASLYASYIKNQVGGRVQIFYDNNVYGDSDSNEEFLALRPEIEKGFQNEKAYIYKEVNGKRYFFMGIPIVYRDDVICTVGYIYPLTKEDEMKKNMTIIAFFLGMIGISIVFIITLFFSYKMIVPITELKNTMKKFALGKEIKEINIHTGDEIEELSHSFQEMVETIQENISQLKQEKEKQKLFFDNVTHEISTPITAILGYADVLKREKLPDHIKEKSIYYIETESMRLINLVEEFLELSSLKRFDFAIIKEPVMLSDLINNCLEIVKIKAKNYNIVLEKKIKDVEIFVDMNKFKEVILNVVDNALKYSNCTSILIEAYPKNGQTIIRIRDNGEGMGKEELEKIWEPFYRSHKNRKVKGTGLGLSICKEIIRNHGGTIAIMSKKGYGTIVEIHIQ